MMRMMHAEEQEEQEEERDGGSEVPVRGIWETSVNATQPKLQSKLNMC